MFKLAAAAFALLSGFALITPSAFAKKRAAVNCAAIPVSQVFEYEVELTWLRLPQPLAEPEGAVDFLGRAFRQISSRARAMEITLGTDSVSETKNLPLVEGSSNPLPESLRIKLPAAAVTGTAAAPVLSFNISVKDGSEDIWNSRAALPVNEGVLQTSRKEFTGSSLIEKFEIQKHPDRFPLRVDEKGINPVYRGIHDGGLAIIVIHRRAKDPQVAVACGGGMKNPIRPAGVRETAKAALPPPNDLSLIALDLDFCTGTLIADRIVLTAAHCLEHRTPEYAGWNLKDRIAVEDVWVSDQTYDRFKAIEIMHDVALLYLKSSMPSQVGVIPLAQPGQQFEKYVRLGYGQRAGADGFIDFALPKILKINEVALYKPSAAGKIKFTQSLEERTCRGDSGGPTLGFSDGKWFLVGVTSKVKNKLRMQITGVSNGLRGKGKDMAIYCGDYYAGERVSENLDLIAQGIRILRERNPEGQ